MIDPIRAEEAKLTATYLNNLAVALFAVGGIGPLVAVLYGTGRATWIVLAGSGVCMIVSPALHFLARRYLRRLPR